MADRQYPRVAGPQDRAASDQEQGQSPAPEAARPDAADLLRALTRALARQAARDAWEQAVGRKPSSETSS